MFAFKAGSLDFISQQKFNKVFEDKVCRSRQGDIIKTFQYEPTFFINIPP